MAVSGFNMLLESMAQADFFSGVLPFVISYVVFYFALKEVPIFDDNNEKVAAIVAVAAAFYVARFIALNALYQQFFVQYFGTLTIGIIGILGLLMVLALVGWNFDDMPGEDTWLMAVLIVIAVAAFTVSGGPLAFLPGQTGTGILASITSLLAFTLESGLIWILVVAGVIGWVMMGEDNGNAGNGNT